MIEMLCYKTCCLQTGIETQVTETGQQLFLGALGQGFYIYKILQCSTYFIGLELRSQQKKSTSKH